MVANENSGERKSKRGKARERERVGVGVWGGGLRPTFPDPLIFPHRSAPPTEGLEQATLI